MCVPCIYTYIPILTNTYTCVYIYNSAKHIARILSCCMFNSKINKLWETNFPSRLLKLKVPTLGTLAAAV